MNKQINQAFHLFSFEPREQSRLHSDTVGITQHTVVSYWNFRWFLLYSISTFGFIFDIVRCVQVDSFGNKSLEKRAPSLATDLQVWINLEVEIPKRTLQMFASLHFSRNKNSFKQWFSGLPVLGPRRPKHIF